MLPIKRMEKYLQKCFFNWDKAKIEEERIKSILTKPIRVVNFHPKHFTVMFEDNAVLTVCHDFRIETFGSVEFDLPKFLKLLKTHNTDAKHQQSN